MIDCSSRPKVFCSGAFAHGTRLFGGFGANQVNFHKGDGPDYSFIGEQIRLLDPINPQVAARMVHNFERWKRFESKR